MRAFVIVDVPILIEMFLNLRYVAKTVPAQQIDIQRAMEAFILALSLRMVRSRVANVNTQPNEPYRQGSVWMIEISAPRRTIIHSHAFWQSIMTECGDQLRLHGFGLLIPTGSQTHDVTRMIVQNRQWMTCPLICHSEPAFKIHLPELIRILVLESLPRLMFLRFRRINLPVSLQNPMDRARARNLFSSIRQNTADLAGPPTRMRHTYGNDSILYCRFRPLRRSTRSSRSIFQSRFTFRLRSLQPLVKRLRAHLKAPTQLADIGSRLRAQTHYFFSKRHGLFHLVPGHSMQPPSHRATLRQVLPMSGNMCYLCLRAIQSPQGGGAEHTKRY